LRAQSVQIQTRQCQKKEKNRMETVTAKAQPIGPLLAQIFRHRKEDSQTMSNEAYALLMSHSASLQELLDYWDGKKSLGDLGAEARAKHDEWLHHTKQEGG
jgi:hypothetical protein